MPQGAGMTAMIAQVNLPSGRGDLPATLESIIDKHGRWRVLLAALAATLRARRQERLPDAAELNDHLRRDIGLPDLPAARASRAYWDAR